MNGRRDALIALRAELEHLRHLRDLSESLVNALRVSEVTDMYREKPDVVVAMIEQGLEPETTKLYTYNEQELTDRVNNVLASIRVAHRLEIGTEEKIRQTA